MPQVLVHYRPKDNSKSSQSLTRYSYVLNNPLRLVDPSGHYQQRFDDGEEYVSPRQVTWTDTAYTDAQDRWDRIYFQAYPDYDPRTDPLLAGDDNSRAWYGNQKWLWKTEQAASSDEPLSPGRLFNLFKEGMANAIDVWASSGGPLQLGIWQRSVAGQGLGISSNTRAMTADQQALKELVDEVSLGGRKPLTVAEADIILDWADEFNYPGWRAKPADVSSPSNWDATGGVPHIHIPGAGRSGHVPVFPGLTPR